MRGIFSRIAAPRTRGDQFFEDGIWNGGGWSSPSATGIQINQQTAMQATTVMACVRILSEDVSKMTPGIFRRVTMFGHTDGGREPAKNHFLYDLLYRPNSWQTWTEFCRMMVIGFCLRGNAYAVIVRDGRGAPQMLVPINPDRVAIWQSPDGSLFYMVTRSGLHEMAVLRFEPFLIPAADILHLKDLSADGLVGMSPIALAREAIALSLGQEQQFARLMGNGARPSGILTTDKVLTKEVAQRLKEDWDKIHSGLLGGGKTAVLEAGLKWQALSLSMADLQFLAARQFQVIEICRIFRVPPHMVGDTSMKVTGQTLVQVSQEYRNSTLTSHTDLWESRLDFTFDLRDQKLFVDFDESKMLKADIATRFNAYRVARFGGWASTNKILMGEGENPVAGGDDLWMPVNMALLRDGEIITPAAPAAGTAADGGVEPLPGTGSDADGEPGEGAGKEEADDGGDNTATDQEEPGV